MSLQLVAQHLAQKGRGPDSTLVHMSNKEVAGLQALAQKHGGQLSVNPETGLPEAGILDNILPAIVGAGVSYFSGGSIDPITAGALVGGGTALATGDLNKGISAGLGAWGGAGMVGGLAGLGAAPITEGAQTAATQAARDEAVKQAVANNTYQDSVASGFGSFKQSPLNSLSALGGGSALKGGLPILAALAPSLTEQTQTNKAPAQKPGYIRKYALDPATGQYKQVGVYEAGGDPNTDVTSQAGTAGAFGGVAAPAARTFADGGSTSSDSQRIYDYLNGIGTNPMQFTHQAPQVNFEQYKPITPTTGILNKQIDEYGNLINPQRGGGGQSQEQRDQREADLNKVSDYLSTPEKQVTMNDYWGMDSQARKDLNDAAAIRNPIRGAVKNVVETLGYPMALRVAGEISNQFKNAFPQEGQARTLFGKVISEGDPSRWGSEVGPNTDNPASTGMKGLPSGLPSAPTAGETSREGVNTGDAKEAARNDASLGIGPENTRAGDNGGWGAGATGGLATPYGIEHMARGGISGHMRPPHPFFQNGKFNFKGPQVYADGGGIADLSGQYNLGSYSDGGRLLKGPGDGVSDNIPATIGHGQPARLADGEFVVPARIVSEIGNGSTDAGARELYKMMDRIQAGRKKTVGKDQVAKNSKAVRHLPA